MSKNTHRVVTEILPDEPGAYYRKTESFVQIAIIVRAELIPEMNRLEARFLDVSRESLCPMHGMESVSKLPGRRERSSIPLTRCVDQAENYSRLILMSF